MHPLVRRRLGVMLAGTLSVGAVVLLIGWFLGAPRFSVISGGQLAQSVNNGLNEAVARVVLQNAPGDALIVVDNHQSGRTPSTLSLEAGDHDLRLIRSTYEDW